MNIDFGKFAVLKKENYELIKKKYIAVVYPRMSELLEQGKEPLEKVAQSFEDEIFNTKNMAVEILVKRLAKCYAEIDGLKNWISFEHVYKGIRQSIVSEFLDIAIAEKINAKDFSRVFSKVYYFQWIDYILHNSGETLQMFNRISHDEVVKQFKNKDIVQFEINKAEIRTIVSKKRPPVDMISPGSSVYLLSREAGKKRKQKSIRNLLEEIGDLIQDIKPCFLMSPLSVSTYLSSSSVKFDVVIFDEASQIFPQDAVGAIYRGNQLIVAGDSKQMPPTDFFRATVDPDDYEEEVGDVNDFDSLLDMCKGSMTQISLLWHYRSHYEQLISYSNKFFYDSELITFPSSLNEKEKKWVGVTYNFVDGVYARRQRVNRKEADYIVDLIYENFRRYPNRSLGVVTFNVAQQDLIDRLLTKRRQSDPAFEELFSADRKEAFFIKNLETVQGDERDTIILNTIYGKDEQGRLSQNYGPINRNGGERRLNVAVTRAKDSIQLVTSLHGTDISIGDTASAKGKRLLREYLEFAEKGEIALEAAITSIGKTDEFDSDFEMEVCDFLRGQGFEVTPQVGCSRYRIDLGLKRPNSSDYVLAIECDGATYHSSKNARDRDRLRQEILERMGWRFYRIWSTDWFKNTAIEKERLLKTANEALAINRAEKSLDRNLWQEENSSNRSLESFEETIEMKTQHFSKYVSADIDKLRSQYNDRETLIAEIVKVEAPISEEWLLKRILTVYGQERLTKNVRTEFEKDLQVCAKFGIQRKNGFLYLQHNKKYAFRVPTKQEERRDLKYIAPEELAVGMLVFISRNINVDKTGLYISIMNEQGYKRLTEGMRDVLDVALEQLQSYRLIDVEGERISMRNK